ncbi:hypothetical protein [Actinoplanes sp. NPDC049265]|uniref:hypothetical protein n=1 Tax=Actinoplanes sp. NPDC049265 TaxID=3363902 RepID=UPI0037195BC8
MPRDADAARRAVARAVEEIERPVDGPVLRLTVHSGGARPPLVVVQVNAKLGGRLVRSQAAASTIEDAVHRTVDGLRRRMRRLDRHLRAEAAGEVSPVLHRWRVPFLAAPVGLVARPALPATLIRTKTCPAVIHHVGAAACIMELRDYPFHLFLEDTTLSPAVLCHGGVTGLHLIRSVAGAATSPVTASSRLAVPIRVAEAVRTLNAEPAWPFLFFLDPASGHGRVLYRRYDGHLGLLIAT